MQLSRLVCLAFLALLTNSARAQSAYRETPNIDPVQQRRLLHSRNGLEALARMAAGHWVVDDTRGGGFVDYRFDSALKASSLVVEGAITGIKSRLVENGDDIVTDFTVRPTEVLKGSAQNNITVEVRGGKFTFPNGDTAEISSLLAGRLRVDGTYVFFLAKEEDVFVPVGNYQMVFDVSKPDAIVPLAAFDSRRHFTILDEVKTKTLVTSNNLIQHIQSIVTE